jgi:hypothetical protein
MVARTTNPSERIRFQLVRFDEGARHYLGFARQRVRTLLDAGLTDGFTRAWRIGDAKIIARCVPVGDGFIARLSLASAAATPVAFPCPTVAHSPAVQLPPLSYTAAILPADASQTGVPNDLGSLAQDYDVPTRHLWVSEIELSDDPVAPANIEGVLDQALVRSCSVSVMLTDEPPQRPPASSELFLRLFDQRHGPFLASYVGAALLLLKTPDGLRGVFHEYLDVPWTPIFFWKRKASDGNSDEIWALCRCTSATGVPLSSDNAIPYTGDYSADRFAADDLIGAAVDPENNQPLAPPSTFEAAAFVFLAAPLLDLATALEHADGTYMARQAVRAAIGSRVAFTFFGAEYGIDVLANRSEVAAADREMAPGTSRELSLIHEFEDSTYRLAVQFTGALRKSETRALSFEGVAYVLDLGIKREKWTGSTQLPDSSPPAYGRAGIHALTRTVGVPFEKGVLIDARQILWTEKPDYVTPRQVVYEQAPVGSNFTERNLTCAVWADYFLGVFFWVFNTQRTLRQSGPPGSYASASHRIREAWVQLVGVNGGLSVASSGAGDTVATVETVTAGPTTYTRQAAATLLRGHRGRLVALGRMDDPAGAVSPAISIWSRFAPSDELIRLGLREQLYPGVVHPDLRYFESLPDGRYYRGQAIEPTTAPEVPWVPQGFVGSIDSRFVGETGVRSVYVFDNERLSRAGVATAVRLDAMDYPYPRPFLPPTSSGRAPGATLPVYPAITLYWPNLKPGKHGFCLLKLAPDAQLVRAIYFLLSYDEPGFKALRAYIDKLYEHSLLAVYNSWRSYRLAIASLRDQATRMHGLDAAARINEFDLLRSRAKDALRASYDVVANNFASPEIMDVFIESAVIIP